jgi:arginase family enzyme
MPLRMIVDSGAVRPADVALVAVRDLDPPERDFIRDSGIHTGDDAVQRALGEAACVYVAVDFDGLDQDEVSAFMPVPGGLAVADTEALLRGVAADAAVVGAGFTGLLPDSKNLEPAVRLGAALGL